MYIIFLKFSHGKSKANEFMQSHKDWLKRGFEDGVFLLAGSLEPGLGGGILADNLSLTDLQERVNNDPFVTEDVVKAEIFELDPSKADERLQFLIK